MENLRNNPPKEINGSRVIKVNDYKVSISHNLETNEQTKIDLPSSNVLAYFLDDGCSFIVRPSGTEPKIKLYVGAVESTDEKSLLKRTSLQKAATELLGF